MKYMKNDSHIPVYFRISRSIIRKNQNRELDPGQRIVSENRIKKNYKVSNTPTRKMQQTMGALIIDGQQLEYFGKTKQVPGFRVDGVTFCGKELVLEREETVYCGDFYQFNMEATP